MLNRATSIRLALLCTLLLVIFSCVTAAAEGFPLREKYPDVKYMTTDELAANFNTTIAIDVRSKVEYNIAHINRALNISLANETFVDEIEKLRTISPTTTIATYCNGHTCAKSYKAAQKAQEAGVNNIFVYDAGIFDWILAHPDRATLMGQTPAPVSKIISKENFTAKMLPWSDFSKKVADADTLVIDIREPFQRKEIPNITDLLNIPMDDLIKRLWKKEYADKQLLFIDAVGKQVRWLQYHLEANGYTNYYFLKEGVRGIK